MCCWTTFAGSKQAVNPPAYSFPDALRLMAIEPLPIASFLPEKLKTLESSSRLPTGPLFVFGRHSSSSSSRERGRSTKSGKANIFSRSARVATRADRGSHHQWRLPYIPNHLIKSVTKFDQVQSSSEEKRRKGIIQIEIKNSKQTESHSYAASAKYPLIQQALKR